MLSFLTQFASLIIFALHLASCGPGKAKFDASETDSKAKVAEDSSTKTEEVSEPEKDDAINSQVNTDSSASIVPANSIELRIATK